MPKATNISYPFWSNNYVFLIISVTNWVRIAIILLSILYCILNRLNSLIYIIKIMILYYIAFLLKIVDLWDHFSAWEGILILIDLNRIIHHFFGGNCTWTQFNALLDPLLHLLLQFTEARDSFQLSCHLFIIFDTLRGTCRILLLHLQILAICVIFIPALAAHFSLLLCFDFFNF